MNVKSDNAYGLYFTATRLEFLLLTSCYDCLYLKSFHGRDSSNLKRSMEAFSCNPPDSSFTVIKAYLIQPFIHTVVDTASPAAAATAPTGTKQ